jgi:hypothetical protein
MNAKFMADAEQDPEEERAAHAAFDAEQEHRKEAMSAQEESNDDGDFDWSGSDPKEEAAEQRALFASFETLKKAEDDTNEALRHQLL